MKSASHGVVLNGSLQMLHIHKLFVTPLGAGYMAQSGANQHRVRTVAHTVGNGPGLGCHHIFGVVAGNPDQNHPHMLAGNSLPVVAVLPLSAQEEVDSVLFTANICYLKRSTDHRHFLPGACFPCCIQMKCGLRNRFLRP